MRTVRKKIMRMACGLAIAVAPVAAMSAEATSAGTATNAPANVRAQFAVKSANDQKGVMLKDGTTLVYDFDTPVVRDAGGAFSIPEGFKVEVSNCTRQKLSTEGVKILSATGFENAANFNKDAVEGSKFKVRLRLKEDGLYLYKVKGICVKVY